MQAITTKFLTATNTRNDRISAHCDAGWTTLPYPRNAPDQQHAHAIVAMYLAHKLGWTHEAGYGDWVCADIGTGYVFVSTEGTTYTAKPL